MGSTWLGIAGQAGAGVRRGKAELAKAWPGCQGWEADSQHTVNMQSTYSQHTVNITVNMVHITYYLQYKTCKAVSKKLRCWLLKYKINYLVVKDYCYLIVSRFAL